MNHIFTPEEVERIRKGLVGKTIERIESIENGGINIITTDAHVLIENTSPAKEL